MGDLGDGLRRYQEQGFCSFHTPGHKGRQEFFHGMNFPDFDLTELPGLDMLHSAEGIIAEAQKHAAEIFGAEETFFLVNGGTVGNQGMFLALEGAEGKGVVVERNAHRSVFSALILSGFKPEYLRPVIHPDFQLPLGLEVKEQAIPWPEILACQVTYPSYYGTVFDFQQLTAERARWGPQTPILVDQAHGAHFLSPLFPPSALTLGADLVLHSTHKTLGALTQAAMLHVQGRRIQRGRLRQSLELLQSSSPNYLLLASLEKAAESAANIQRWEALREEVEALHDRVGRSCRLLSPKDIGSHGIQGVDWSKILINIAELGVSATYLVARLRKEYGLEPELWDEENILFLLGIGNEPEDVRRLAKGLEQLVNSLHSTGLTAAKRRHYKNKRAMMSLPPCILTPRAAFLAPKRQVPLQESVGQIVGETISPYPPGTPVIVMGEEMTPEIAEMLLRAEEERWQGWQGLAGKTVWIVE